MILPEIQTVNKQTTVNKQSPAYEQKDNQSKRRALGDLAVSSHAGCLVLIKGGSKYSRRFSQAYD
jgi:hypothetical protein